MVCHVWMHLLAYDSTFSPPVDSLLESQTRMMKRSLRRRGIEQVDNKTNKRKQLSDILFPQPILLIYIT